MDDAKQDSYLWNTANQLIKKDLEHYFPALSGETIPTARNPRINEVLTIRKIKNDTKWMIAMRCQSILQNLPLDDILKAEAQNVMYDRPLMRDTTKDISRETYVESLTNDMVEQIRNKPVLMEQIQQKAMENGKTIEEQLRADARWIINDKIQKGEIVWEE